MNSALSRTPGRMSERIRVLHMAERGWLPPIWQSWLEYLGFCTTPLQISTFPPKPGIWTMSGSRNSPIDTSGRSKGWKRSIDFCQYPDLRAKAHPTLADTSHVALHQFDLGPRFSPGILLLQLFGQLAKLVCSRCTCAMMQILEAPVSC